MAVACGNNENEVRYETHKRDDRDETHGWGNEMGERDGGTRRKVMSVLI